jgi:hypothetical protein
VEDTRTYLDGATVIADIGYRRYGPGKAISGASPFTRAKSLGRSTATSCWPDVSGLAVEDLSDRHVVETAANRPAGCLAHQPTAAPVALAAVVVPLGLLYPLVGASLVIVLIFDFSSAASPWRSAPPQRLTYSEEPLAPCRDVAPVRRQFGFGRADDVTATNAWCRAATGSLGPLAAMSPSPPPTDDPGVAVRANRRPWRNPTPWT